MSTIWQIGDLGIIVKVPHICPDGYNTATNLLGRPFQVDSFNSEARCGHCGDTYTGHILGYLHANKYSDYWVVPANWCIKIDPNITKLDIEKEKELDRYENDARKILTSHG